MAKPTIKYKSFVGKDPRTEEPRLGVTITERVVKHTEEIAAALIKGGYAIGIQKSLLVGVLNAVADYIVDALNEGQTLLFDNRLSIRLDLVGKPNEDGTISAANEVKVNAIPLNESKKVSKDSFSWERVNDDGRAPKIDCLITDAAGAERGKLMQGQPVLALGKNLSAVPGETLTVTWKWKHEGAAKESAASLTFTGKEMLKMAWPTAVSDMQPDQGAVTLELAIESEQGRKTATAAATVL